MADALAGSPFGRLPAELIKNVFEQLDYEHIFKLRLVCKTFRCHATGPAFKELFVWLEDESLQSLLSIARNPQLRENVKTISFSMDHFYNVDQEIFTEDIHPHPEASPTDAQTSAETAWTVYRKYLRKQRFLVQSGEALAAMIKSFAAFPRSIKDRPH